MILSTMRSCFGCQREGADSVIEWKQHNERVLLTEYVERDMSWERVSALTACISEQVKKCLDCAKVGEAY